MKNTVLTVLAIMSFSFGINAQDGGFHFGPKGGLSIGNQQWDNYERRPLFTNHAALFIETLDPEYTGSLFAQIGLHKRGSAIRSVGITSLFNSGIEFTNAAVQLGFKKRIDPSKNFMPYYFFAIRVEYTVDTNLDRFEGNGNCFFPFNAFVNEWNYGVTLGGGFEYELSEFVIPFIEFNFSPDFSLQYRSPALNALCAINPWTGTSSGIPEREIRNLTFEVSIGFKFLRKVIYEDY